MTQAEINSVKVVLEARMRVVLEQLNVAKGNIRIAESSPEVEERIMQEIFRNGAITPVNNSSANLRDTQDALKRLGAGCYGTCESCEEEIKPNRLRAVPWARYCTQCQDAFEQNRGVLAKSNAA